MMGMTQNLNSVVITSWFVIAPISLALFRLITRSALNYIRTIGLNSRKVAIVGMTEEGNSLAEYIQANPSLGMQLVGIYDDRSTKNGRTSNVEHTSIVGSVLDLIHAAKKNDVDIVYVAISLKGEARIQKFLKEFSDTTLDVFYIPDIFSQKLFNSRRVNLGPVSTIAVYDSPFNSVDGCLKRLEDLVLSSMILIVIALPMLLIALLVKATSPGPIFFKQRRYGLDGNVIQVWKFRTMTVLEDGDNIIQAKKNDSRLTKVGTFLRRYSLDELPQFFNVLRGNMSIVGPRPHAIYHNEQYRKLVSGYMLRHKVKPGITGWAQVNGFRGNTEKLEDMEKRIQHDLWYISNWSIGVDLKIIVLTLFVSFTDPNAY
jgi:putative colanic acid biosynthesis UDP-glucose lipid carrier transferase